MKKMLVLSGLFFNASGNQSMEQSIVGYMKEYEVHLVTAANMNGAVYKTIESVKALYPELRVYAVGGTRLLAVLSQASGFIKKVAAPLLSSGKVKKAGNQKVSAGIVNSPAGLGTRFFFLVREVLLFLASLVLTRLHRFDAVCAYEINATRPVACAKRFLPPAAVTFGKFQGTVLGSIRHDLQAENNRSLYWMDLKGMSVVEQLDGNIMTNDGTFGDEVLRLHHVSDERILFIPNGVALERITNDKRPLRDTLEIISVSRLTLWKRVHVMVEAIKILRDKYQRMDFVYRIYGVGSEAEEMALIELIDDMQLQSQVTYCGRLAHSEVQAAFSNADMLASIYAHSNVCNPVFEASYLGTPVLTIDSPELRSVAGKASEAYFFIEDSDEDSILAERVAARLNGLDAAAIVSAGNYLRECCDAFNSWAERSAKEVSFIQSVKQC
jgi:glycosyltransferase involved in cell wall biosynthesis